jgi:predicted transcriptional regulator
MHDDVTRDALLIALRVKGAADSTQLRTATHSNEDECERALTSLMAEGLIAKNKSQQKYILTDAGKQAVSSQAERERHAIGQVQLEQLYDRFMILDADFKRLAGGWQVCSPGPPPVFNDHSDPRYDERIIKNLVRLHHRLRSLVEALGEQCPRYNAYRVRFADSLNRLSDGSADYFTNPRVDSYHNIWFELHEDLLCTLGRQRSE